MQELISIIVPVYNAETFLKKTLNSVKQQSYQNIEVIMIDDGSTDTSPLICDSFVKMDNRFRVIHQKNAGPSTARNRGIEEARGEYLSFLDNDDLLHEDFVKNLYYLCVKYECDIALTRVSTFLGEAEIQQEIGEEHLRFMNHIELSIQLLDMGWDGISVSMAKLYRRSLFESIRFNENRVIADDDSIIYSLYWISHKAVLDERGLYYYRSKRQMSITHSQYTLSWMTGIDAFRERMEFYYRMKEPLLYAKAMRSYCRRMSENYLSICKNFPSEQKIRRELKWKIRKKTFKMFFLKGNSLQQKGSAIILAWSPFLWHRLHNCYCQPELTHY